MDFKLNSYLMLQQELINKSLNEFLPAESAFPERIHSAMRYSVFAGGKRLRPILTLAAAEAVGGIKDSVVRVACAIEFLHTYSLIHDDLPAMDNDDYRRGKLTCHKVYGEAVAILAGDALLTHAFEMLSDLHCKNDLSIIIKEISAAVGSKGMIGGQVVDFLSERDTKQRTIETLQYIHANKTGALFKAAIKCGGILAGADRDQLALLEEYAHCFGLAFQITDDILDIEGNSEELGKPIGSDQKNHKLTYPELFGLTKSKRLAAENSNKAINAVAMFGEKGRPLSEIAKYVLTRTF